MQTQQVPRTHIPSPSLQHVNTVHTEKHSPCIHVRVTATPPLGAFGTGACTKRPFAYPIPKTLPPHTPYQRPSPYPIPRFAHSHLPSFPTTAPPPSRNHNGWRASGPSHHPAHSARCGVRPTEPHDRMCSYYRMCSPSVARETDRTTYRQQQQQQVQTVAAWAPDIIAISTEYHRSVIFICIRLCREWCMLMYTQAYTWIHAQSYSYKHHTRAQHTCTFTCPIHLSAHKKNKQLHMCTGCMCTYRCGDAHKHQAHADRSKD